MAPSSLKTQILTSIGLSFAAIALLFAAMLVPFETGRYQILVSAIKQRVEAAIVLNQDDLVNNLFMDHARAATLRTEQLRKSGGFVSVEVFRLDGRLFAASSALAPGQADTSFPLQALGETGFDGSPLIFLDERYDGESILTCLGRLSAIGEDFGYIRVRASLAAPIRETRAAVLLFTGLLAATLLVLFGVLHTLLSRMVTRPLARLKEAMGEVETGHFDTQVTVRTGNEIEEMAEAFNRMTQTAGRAYADLDAMNRTLEARVDERTKELTAINSALRTEVDVRAKTELALQAAKEDADAASKAKSDFLSAMSHEIRTPMNAIQGMAELLEETDIDAEQGKYLSVLKSAGDSLLALINDILDLSRVEAGKLELAERPFSPHTLARHTCELLQGEAAKRSILLDHELDPDVPERIVGDPFRLRQILLNLLSNAVKFTPVGSVTLTVKTDLSPTPGTRRLSLAFTVKDTGLGIPAAEQDVIFERFRQLDSSSTRKHGGSGLGLAITRELVQLMGGSIELTSAVNVGSSFTVRLPFRLADEGALPSDSGTDGETPFLAQQAVLALTPETRRGAIEGHLGSWGATVTTASEPAVFLRLAGAEPYALALVDRASASRTAEGLEGFLGQAHISLGEHTPLALMDALKVTRSELKATLLSSLASPDSTRIPGADSDASTGPNAPPAAIDGSSPAGQNAPMVPQLDGKRILLVEDSEFNIFLVKSYLRDSGAELSVAENGRDGVELYKSAPYDIVLMDMEMPIMDGYEATRAIREYERAEEAPHIPVIALTAHALIGDESKCTQAGCDLHLAKPVKKQALLAAIRKILAQHGRA